MVYYYNGAQRYEQFLQVGWLYRALVLLGLARSLWCYTYILKIVCLHPSLYLLISQAWWDWPLTWLTNHCPSVLWRCWLGHTTHQIVSEMTSVITCLSGYLWSADEWERCEILSICVSEVQHGCIVVWDWWPVLAKVVSWLPVPPGQRWWNTMDWHGTRDTVSEQGRHACLALYTTHCLTQWMKRWHITRHSSLLEDTFFDELSPFTECSSPVVVTDWMSAWPRLLSLLQYTGNIFRSQLSLLQTTLYKSHMWPRNWLTACSRSVRVNHAIDWQPAVGLLRKPWNWLTACSRFVRVNREIDWQHAVVLG